MLPSIAATDPAITRPPENLVGRGVNELPTPALLADLNAVEQNLRTMAAFFADKPVKLRPHFKNHRVVELALQQMDYGAVGITCARLWQAEVLLNAGIREILIANEVVSDGQLRRLAKLSREGTVLVAVDNPAIVKDMARVARSYQANPHIVVDVDLGLKRCGVKPGDEAVALAKSVIAEGLTFHGIMGYEGHLQSLPAGLEKENAVHRALKHLTDTRQQIEAAGIPVKIVSCGGTGDYRIAGAFPGVTENQAGSYLFMDTWYAPFAGDFKPALSALGTVISKTPGERIVLDAGVKAISGERGLPMIKGRPGLRLKALHAEHAPVEILESDLHVNVGDKLEISVHYHDGTIQLHHRMYGIRDGKVEQVFPIEHGD